MATRRTGMPTLKKLALRMCSIIRRYESIIILVYPEATALHAAVAAAGAACRELEKEVSANLPVGV